jgi:hypothetical protein
MLFFMSNFIIFPNCETLTNFIHIQTLAGVRICVYWFINILYYLISVILLILPLLASIILMDVLAYESVVFKISEICTLIYLEFAVIQLRCRKLFINMFYKAPYLNNFKPMKTNCSCCRDIFHNIFVLRDWFFTPGLHI